MLKKEATRITVCGGMQLSKVVERGGGFIVDYPMGVLKPRSENTQHESHGHIDMSRETVKVSNQTKSRASHEAGNQPITTKHAHSTPPEMTLPT